MKLLWLPGWYPNKTGPFDGDFIQRHARATALYHQVDIIHIVRDKDGKVTKNVLEENQLNMNVNEKIIYYYISGMNIVLLEKILSVIKQRKLYRKAVKNYLAVNGKPSCVHLHVVNKNGLAALWLKRKYNIPFLVSEQWTVYLPEAVPTYSDLSFLFKLMWRKIITNATGFTVVSKYLGNALEAIQQDLLFEVIPNVVDGTAFFPVEKKTGNTVNFIHISTLGHQKNPAAILHAFAIVKKTSPAFRLSVFGPLQKELEKLATDLDLQKHVSFHQEVPQPQLAVFMQQSDALILYSRYETFGCVVIEANACGIPVIASDIPVFHETIKENVNGYFVQGDNPELLAQKIIWFMNQKREVPDKKIIAATTEKYNYSNVGKLFSTFYKTALES
jgi:glycosyltransferase involved in cell wall biosynthesis